MPAGAIGSRRGQLNITAPMLPNATYDTAEVSSEEKESGTMMLSEMLQSITVRKIFQMTYGRMVITEDLEITGIQYDSRRVSRGNAFVAIRGTAADGHAFVTDAVARGATAVVLEDDAILPDSFFLHAGVAKIVVPDTRIALAQIASAYYHHPSRRMTMVGVTGTNGKTTTTHLIRALLEGSGIRTGLVGTIEYDLGGEILPATHTTPESLDLNALFARMVSRGCGAAVMEVSSHALHQHRVFGIGFRAGVFTNLTQDHLDYHASMEEYFKAKKILFDGLGKGAVAVINVDDEWGRRLVAGMGAPAVTYGTTPGSDVLAEDIALSTRGTRFTIRHGERRMSVESPLLGRFNVSNLLAAYAAGLSLGIDPASMVETMRSARTVKGRFEQIPSRRGWTTIIDYAHTPDALEKALKAIRDLFDESNRGRVITVFGCGGNRDRRKRPIMAGVATTLSDITIITSDNPRHEDPQAIITEALTGVRAGAQVQVEPDRRSAILTALGLARSGDVVLVAGKGHEDYQVVGDRKIPFSDREVVEEYLSTER